MNNMAAIPPRIATCVWNEKSPRDAMSKTCLIFPAGGCDCIPEIESAPTIPIRPTANKSKTLKKS